MYFHYYRKSSYRFTYYQWNWNYHLNFTIECRFIWKWKMKNTVVENDCTRWQYIVFVFVRLPLNVCGITRIIMLANSSQGRQIFFKVFLMYKPCYTLESDVELKSNYIFCTFLRYSCIQQVNRVWSQDSFPSYRLYNFCYAVSQYQFTYMINSIFPRKFPGIFRNFLWIFDRIFPEFSHSFPHTHTLPKSPPYHLPYAYFVFAK